MNIESQFGRYTKAMAELPDSFVRAEPLPESLRMAGDGRYEIYYAPFDDVVSTARIVLVGITPGRTQALAALNAAREGLRRGIALAAVQAEAKTTASFAGPMRRNLVALLDHVGVAKKLGIDTTAKLWTTQHQLVHFTSCLRYPVFDRGKNFGGSGLKSSALLAGEVDHWFAAECRALPKALFVPLGPAPLWACDRMVAVGTLRAGQVLRGLPHPSGANAERIAYFLGRKARGLLSAKTNPDILDSSRERALRSVNAWV